MSVHYLFNFILTVIILDESDEVVAEVFRWWNDAALDLRYSRFGHESMVMIVLYSIPGRFVIPCFKGTSPFNLNEWVTDCSIGKSAVKNSLLPGAIHTVRECF